MKKTGEEKMLRGKHSFCFGHTELEMPMRHGIEVARKLFRERLELEA